MAGVFLACTGVLSIRVVALLRWSVCSAAAPAPASSWMVSKVVLSSRSSTQSRGARMASADFTNGAHEPPSAAIDVRLPRYNAVC